MTTLFFTHKVDDAMHTDEQTPANWFRATGTKKQEVVAQNALACARTHTRIYSAHIYTLATSSGD